MRHRGPDDEGVRIDPAHGVSLGATRLSVIDVEGGHQPLSNEDGSVWAVLNGEIYNHPLLRSHLLERGHRLATATDTEVLVHLYEEYGPALVHSLEGMFAFAVWDSRARQLLIGRDRFGEKPLFYAERSGDLTFASELTALLAGDAGPSRDLDPDAVDDFFVFGYVPGPRSIVRGVHQLPPGSLLTWSPDGRRVVVRPYWMPPEPESQRIEALEDLTAELGRSLRASVKSRMIADVPLGVFLSGGVDSSLVAAIAARASRDPIKTFTVGYDVGSVSEAEEARRIAQEIGAEHHDLTLGTQDVAITIPDLLAKMDQPIADQALVATYAVSAFARREVTVVVGGEGADELFGGYPRYRWLDRAARLDQTAYAGTARRIADAASRLPLTGKASRLIDLAGAKPVLEQHLDWVTSGRRHQRPTVYGPLLAGGAGLNGRILQDLATRCGDLRGDGVGGRLMRLDQTHWLPDDVLAKADRASMLSSLEVRTPYLNRELAELAAGVGLSDHLRRDGKAALRALLSEALPGVRRRRPKTAFRVPATDWLRGPLAPLLDAQISTGALYEEGWFDGFTVGRLAHQHVTRTHDHTNVLWPLLTLGLWLDRFRGQDGC